MMPTNYDTRWNICSVTLVSNCRELCERASASQTAGPYSSDVGVGMVARNLKRARHPMPEFVRRALLEHDLMHAYGERSGTDRYMKMAWRPRGWH